MAKENILKLGKGTVIEEESKARGSGVTDTGSPSGDNEGAGEEEGSDTVQEEVLSPFLPGTKVQYACDSTYLGDFKRCPRLYYYTMIEGWRPREDNVHIRFGAEFHQVVQAYEKLKADRGRLAFVPVANGSAKTAARSTRSRLRHGSSIQLSGGSWWIFGKHPALQVEEKRALCLAEVRHDLSSEKLEGLG